MRINSTFGIAAVALALATVAASAGSASASPWTATHPWRAEVNDRLGIQNDRVDLGVATGQITPWQAAVLHSEDHSVRVEERFMASMNGGHLTPFEDNLLNRQENVISNQIGY